MSASLFPKLPQILFIMLLSQPLESTSGSTLKPMEDRITNGVQCAIQDVPFAVFLLIKLVKNGDTICAGSLITKNWILTAAHCVNLASIKNNLTEARMGISVIGGKANSGVQRRIISRGEIFDKYPKVRDDYENRYDIGLLHTPNPFKITSNVRIAKLPTSKDFTKSCRPLTAAGWGHTELLLPDKTPPSLNAPIPLHCASVKLMFDLKKCLRNAHTARWKIDDSVLCLPVGEDRSGTCYGDSGGPVFCEKDIIVGVISSTFGCGQPGLFSLATRVDRYFAFIDKHIGMTPSFKSEPLPKLADSTQDSQETKKGEKNSSWSMFSDKCYYVSVSTLFAMLNIACLPLSFWYY